MKKQVHSIEVRNAALARLTERGVTVEDIAEIVYLMQSPYHPDLTMEPCIESVKAVLEKGKCSTPFWWALNWIS